MVSWKCPQCGVNMYSACEDRDCEAVECINCGNVFPNIYHQNACKQEKETKEEAE